MTAVTPPIDALGGDGSDNRPEGLGDGASSGRLGDRLFHGTALGAGWLVIAVVVLVGAFLVSQAVPSLAKDQVNFLTSRVWDVGGSQLRFGIADLLWVTVVSSIVAMAIAVPVSIGVALFLTQYAPRRLAKPFAALVDLLAAVPSIVYGLWGIKVLGSHVKSLQGWLSDHLGWFPLFSGDVSISSTGTIFLASIVLAIMILPIVTALSREVFAQVPLAHKEGALALGETIAVTIIVSTLAQGTTWSWSLFNGGETFASRIANNAAEFDSPDKAGAFIAAGLVLFVLTFVVNAIARVIIERRKAFTE